MPYKTDKQRKYMHANFPNAEWHEKAIAKLKKLPKEEEVEKEAELPPNDARDAHIYQKLKDVDGQILAYAPGFGKTSRGMKAAKNLGMPAHWIIPASLKGNLGQEYQKWQGGMPEGTTVESQQGLSRGKPTQVSPNGLMILDESQNGKNHASKLARNLKNIPAAKRLLLSGTLLANNPADIASNVNLVAGKNVLPADPREFADKYINEEEVKPGLFGRMMGVTSGKTKSLKNTGELGGILSKYIDYAENSPEGYPTVKKDVVNVPMGKNQQDLYSTVMGKADFWTRYKVKHNLPPTKQEFGKMRSFLSGLRQMGDSNEQYVTDPSKIESPKVDAAVKYFADQLKGNPDYKALIYSNYINSGLHPYGEKLKQLGIPYGEFSGAVSDKVRNQSLQDYNAGKIKALLLSQAGTTGLNTKNTRLVQLLEPHWNEALENQTIARAVRFHSHDSLPEDQRNVLVQRYLSTLRKPMFGSAPTSTDQYIRNLAVNKNKLNDQVYDILRQRASMPQ